VTAKDADFRGAVRLARLVRSIHETPIEPGTMFDNPLLWRHRKHRPSIEEPMRPARDTVLKLLDRSLIGLLIFVVMLLLGIQAVHAG